MSRGRDRVAMTSQEVQDFLSGQRKVQIATLDKDGAPHLTTLFYVLLDGRIACWTYAASQKVRNLRRDPRASALVEAGEDYHELRGVSINGHARLVEEYDDVLRLGKAVAGVLAPGADLGEDGEELVAQQAWKRVGVVIEPAHVASWDHAKMT